MTQPLRGPGPVFGRNGKRPASRRPLHGDSEGGRKSKRGPSAAFRAREKRGEGKDARNSAQDDDVTGIAADLAAGCGSPGRSTKIRRKSLHMGLDSRKYLLV
jgi:hypothetical protein